jgi:hypothetical protein
VPHHRHPKKHKQGQCRKQPTRQESASRRGQDGREDRDIGEILERRIPLAMNNLLVTPHNLKALMHHIQTLISVSACGGAEGAPPLRVVRDGVATEELAREALGSLGIAGRRES